MLLQTIADGLVLLSKPVHSTVFPFPIGPTIHAARTSIAYQTLARASGSTATIPWPTYIVGYLIMSWGGAILTHHLLHLPPPILYTPTPYLIYIPTHLLLTLLFSSFPSLLSPATSSFLALLDTLAIPLDAMVRTGSVTSALAHLHLPTKDKTTVHPALASSPLTHLIIGALAASGGSLLASTLSTWTPTWTLSTPPVLRAPTLGAFVWAGLDLWAGAFAAAVYGVVTGHVAFDEVGIRGSTEGGKASGQENMWTEMEGKALCVVVLAVCGAARVYKLHWVEKAVKDKKEGVKDKKE